MNVPPPRNISSKRLIKPLLAALLVLAMLFSINIQTFACFPPLDLWKMKTYGPEELIGGDGITYTIEAWDSPRSSRVIEVKLSNTKDYYRYEIFRTKNEIKYTKYTYVNLLLFGFYRGNSETESFAAPEAHDRSDEFYESPDIEAQAIGDVVYAPKVATAIKKWGEYWYRRGSDSKTADEYMKVGLDSNSKDINITNLTKLNDQRKVDNCDNFCGAIDLCNSKFATAEAAFGVSGALTALVIVVTLILFPPAVIASVGVAAIGGIGTTWYTLIESFKAYQKAEQLYAVIRYY